MAHSTEPADKLPRLPEQLTRMLERITDAFYAIDRDWRFTWVNREAEKLLQRSRSELMGRSIWSEFPETVGLIFHDAYRKAVSTGEPQEFEAFYPPLGRWFEVRAFPGEDWLSVYFRDISARKRAEKERAELLAREKWARMEAERLAAEHAAVLGQIADGVVITDPSGSIVFMNEAARRIHGHVELRVPVQAYAETFGLYTVDGRPIESTDLPLARAVLRGETVIDSEWMVRRPDGVEIIAQGSAAPVRAPDGTPLGAVLTVRDVTEQRTLERQKDEFLAAAAHDLKNPLTAIKGRIQLLERRVARLEEPDRTLIETGLAGIQASAARMLAQIDQLLDFTRYRMGRPMPLERQPTDLVSLVRQVVSEYQQSSDRHRIVLDAVSALEGEWDPDRIERAVSNLMSNAIKYSPQGGEITVRVWREGDGQGTAVVSVRDPGIGIPKEDLPLVFERFRRARNVRDIGGTGVGLAGACQVVRQHEGSISVESAPGRGSTFTIRLPIEPPGVTTPLPSPPCRG